MGYFEFRQHGVDPVKYPGRAIFDPLDKLLSRLAWCKPYNKRANRNAQRPFWRRAGRRHTGELSGGQPWGLPYNGLEHDAGVMGRFSYYSVRYESERDVGQHCRPCPRTVDGDDSRLEKRPQRIRAIAPSADARCAASRQAGGGGTVGHTIPVDDGEAARDRRTISVSRRSDFGR